MTISKYDELVGGLSLVARGLTAMAELEPNETKANGQSAAARTINIATTFITDLQADNARLRGALERADETFEQVLDDMRDGGQCVCLAVKREIGETHQFVRTALNQGPKT